MSINIKVFEMNMGFTHVAMRGDGLMAIARPMSEKSWRNNWIKQNWIDIPSEEERGASLVSLIEDLKKEDPKFDINVL